MKKAHTKTIAVIVLSLLVFGVGMSMYLLKGGYSRTLSETEFEEAVYETTHSKLSSVSYRGRTNGYDYFQTNNLVRKNLKLKLEDSPVHKPFDFTSKSEQWLRVSFMFLEKTEVPQAMRLRFNR